jgi:alpha-L-arabinofuranosidase
MLHGSLHINPKRHRHPIHRHLFGSFLEHMGRAVYEGV